MFRRAFDLVDDFNMSFNNSLKSEHKRDRDDEGEDRTAKRRCESEQECHDSAGTDSEEDGNEAIVADDDSDPSDLESLASSEDAQEGDDFFDDLDIRDDAYDPENEPYPPYAAHHPAYRESDNRILQCLEGFPEVPQDIVTDKRLEILIKSLMTVRKLTTPQPFKIAMLGDAGNGKSSTLKSLLHHIGLAATAAIGRSCTNVIFEYGQPFAWQKDIFAAQIFWHTKDEVQVIIEELLSDYEDHYFSNNPRRSPEEKEENQAAAKSAVESLKAMFCDMEDFSTTANVQKYLNIAHANLGDDFKKSVASKLADIGKANITKHATDTSKCCFSEASVQKLRFHLDQYTKSHAYAKNSTKGSLWHFVKRVYVGINDSRVVRGLSLVDMPGTADRNHFRVRRANRELRTCDGVWIFASINRVCDNQAVYRELKNAVERFGRDPMSNITIVCTRADENINDQMVKALQKSRPQGLDLERWETLQSQLRQAKKEQQQLQLQRKKRKGGKGKLEGLYEKLENLENHISEIKAEKSAFAIKARSEYVEEQVKETFSDMMTENVPLETVCVSNLEYEKLKYVKDEETLPIPPEATGIPKLRQLAMQISAPRIQDAKDANLDSCMRLISQTQLYLKHDLGSVSATLKKFVMTQTERIEPIIAKDLKMMLQSLEEIVIQVLNHERDEFSQTAIKKFKKWTPPVGVGARSKGGWHPSTFIAFCRKFGDHHTKAQGHLNWNLELLETFDHKFDKVWDEFEEHQIKSFEALSEELERLMDEISSKLEEVAYPQTEIFQSLIRTCLNSLNQRVKEEGHRRKKFFLNERLATTKGKEDSYMRGALSPAYEKCRNVKEKPVTQQMIEIMQEPLKSHDEFNPFCMIFQSMRDSFVADMKLHQKRFTCDLRAIFEPILDSFDLTAEDASKDRTIRKQNAQFNDKLSSWVKVAKPKMEEMRRELAAARRILNDAPEH